MNFRDDLELLNLTKVTHENGDIHYIGGALPPPPGVPSPSNLDSTASNGSSPYPARADHTHDIDLTAVTVDLKPTTSLAINGVVAQVKVVSSILVCSGDLILTTTATLVTGLTQVINGLKAGWEVCVSFSVDFDTTVLGAATLATAQLFVSGTATGPSAVADCRTVNRGNRTMFARYTVPVDGNYTFEIRASKTVAAGTCVAKNTNSAMTIDVFASK